jgi:proteic killer suppression protein
VIIGFRDRGTEDIFLQVDSKPARRTCPPTIWPVARRKLGRLDAAERLDDLAFPAGNDLHRLVRDRWGQHAIRINDQYRICFRWTDAGVDDVEIADYH